MVPLKDGAAVAIIGLVELVDAGAPTVTAVTKGFATAVAQQEGTHEGANKHFQKRGKKLPLFESF